MNLIGFVFKFFLFSYTYLNESMDQRYYIFCGEEHINYFPSVDITVNNDPSVFSLIIRGNDQF